jgi:hypothetical protein
VGEILSCGSGASLGKLPFGFEPIFYVRARWASAVLPKRVCQAGDRFVEVFVLLLFADPVVDDRIALDVRSLWMSSWHGPLELPSGCTQRAKSNSLIPHDHGMEADGKDCRLPSKNADRCGSFRSS